MQFPHQLFLDAGLVSTDVAALVGVSRITGYRWLKGSGVNIFLRRRVEKVSQRVQAALDAGRLPDRELSKKAPGDRAKELKSILNLRDW